MARCNERTGLLMATSTRGICIRELFEVASAGPLFGANSAINHRCSA